MFAYHDSLHASAMVFENINPFLVNDPIVYLLKKKHKTFGFLVFLGGIKWEHWLEMC